MPKVLIADELSPRAVEIFGERGIEAERVAYDIGGYRAAPPGLRIWAGATIERSDLDALFPWLDWAFGEVRGAAKAA